MLSNKYILYFVFFISLNVSAQSVLITPGETLLNSEVNRLIIGKDSSSLNADFPLYLNQPLSNRVFVGLKGLSSSAYLGLNNSAKSIKFEIGVSSPSDKVQMNFNLPNGKVTINDAGKMLIGSLRLGDTTNVSLEVSSKKPGTFFLPSTVLISSGVKINHSHPNRLINESHGIYVHADSGAFVNSGIIAEAGESASVANIGVFGRIYKSPSILAKSIAVYGQDIINAPNTYAAEFFGKVNDIGTPAVHTHISILNSIEYLNKIGIKNKQARLNYLRKYWMDALKDVPNVIINTSFKPNRACGIGNVGLKNMTSIEMADKLLSKYKIWTVGINGQNVFGCRITPNLYTTKEELDKFIVAVKELAKG